MQNCKKICQVAAPNSMAFEKCGCEKSVPMPIDNFIIVGLIVGLLIIVLRDVKSYLKNKKWKE